MRLDACHFSGYLSLSGYFSLLLFTKVYRNNGQDQVETNQPDQRLATQKLC